MTERDAAPEGWGVPFGRTAIVALAVPFVLLAALVTAGWGYRRTIAPETVIHVQTQPAPGLETRINISGNDPKLPPRPSTHDRQVETAKARIAAEGLPGWTGRGR